MKIGFVGIGACGGNICEIAELYEYRTVVINTSQDDLDSLQLVKNKLLLGSNGGSGKDRNLSKENLKEYHVKMTNFIKDRFDDDIEIIYLVGSSGGGTGSGVIPMFAELLKKVLPTKRVGIIGVLPSLKESTVAQVNTLEFVREVSKLTIPVFLYDNNKLKKDTVKQAYDKLNNNIIDNFNLLMEERAPSKYGNLDRQDLIKCLSTPGINLQVTTKVERNAEELSMLPKKIIDSIESSLFCPIDYDNIIKRMGFIYEFYEASTKGLTYDEIQTEFGKPLEIFEGFYKPVDKNQQVITYLAGLSFPQKRMEEIADLLEKRKGEFVDSKLLDIDTDTSWFEEKKKESQVGKTIGNPVDPSDISDIFNKY